MSLTLLLPFLLAGEPNAAAAVETDDPPIQIWIDNDGRFLRGDRARVHVRTEDDGYLVVLQTDTEGHVRVLFPLDPTDDNFVRGGKKYEVEGRGGRDAFDVGDRSGRGTVYAAVSRSPFRFDEFVLSDHWDYRALAPQPLPEDPEQDLTELARRMAQGSFDYDVLGYYVVDRVVYADDYSYRSSAGFYYDDFGCGYYRSCGSGLSVSLFFGRPFYRRHYYGPYHYAYDPLYDPFFYDPFYYRPYYYRPYIYSPVYYYPRHYWGYPYRHRTVVHHFHGGWDRGRWDRPYSPYRFRDRSLAVNGDYRDRRYTFGRAVNTVYTRPISRFTEPESASPVRRAVDRDGGRSEPVVARRVADGGRRNDQAEPRRAAESRGNAEPRPRAERESGVERRSTAERRGESGRSESTRIEARRARPATPSRAAAEPARAAAEPRSRREAMPVDVSPRRASAEESRSEVPTARRADVEHRPRATPSEPRAEPRPEPRAVGRSEPRSEPRAEPRSAPRSEPRATPRSYGGGDRGGWSSGGGGRRDGGGGGGISSGGGRRR
jgi:hypothetical protein